MLGHFMYKRLRKHTSTIMVFCMCLNMAACANHNAVTAAEITERVDSAQEMAIAPSKALAVRVVSVSDNHGNLDTDLDQHGMVEFGLQPRETFAVSAGDIRVTVLFATTYSDVAEGQWVAFMNDGYLRLARNMANAAETLGVEPGSAIHIHRLPQAR